MKILTSVILLLAVGLLVLAGFVIHDKNQPSEDRAVAASFPAILGMFLLLLDAILLAGWGVVRLFTG